MLIFAGNFSIHKRVKIIIFCLVYAIYLMPHGHDLQKLIVIWIKLDDDS